ncbi:ABC transporter ATP-binding protein, partial [Thioclava sp. BHET1]
ARRASVFLMDEPLSNLDTALRLTMRTEIKELHRKLGATILYVTHDQTEALSLADRIAVMRGGHLLQFAPPAEIYDRPADLFVAGFLGTPPMNLLADALLPGLPVDWGTTIGLRPEAITVHHADPAVPALAGRVVLSEMTGTDLVLHCETDAGRLTALAPRGTAPSQPDRVWLTFDPGRVHRFDRATGARR